jgi:hypothetical protein
MAISPEQIKKLDELNAKARFYTMAGRQEIMNAAGKVIQTAAPEMVVCEIIDITTRETYANGKGMDELSAFEAAIVAARKAEKPLTPAQKLDRAKYLEEQNALKNENEELKRKLAEATAAAERSTSRRSPQTATN